MWTRTYSKTFKNINKETIWNLWTDINNWPQWHDDLEYCKLKGKFKAGNYFWLKPKTMGAVKIMITDVQPYKSFTDCTVFWGAKMYDTHSIEETTDGIKLTNTIKVSGILSWIWIKLVAQYVADSTPDEIEALTTLARKQNEN
ncbi:polyketide cyclase [Candidatus Dependentiae bacterium]|nr:MAG: polyketide cyclase [Candidatus Dependentiae bacterium]